MTSAMSGITNLLVAACERAGTGQRDAAIAELEPIRSKHAEALDALEADARVRAEVDLLHDELDELLRAVAWLREITPRTRAAILSTGEKVASRLLALALRQLDVPAVALDADTFLDTDDQHAEASPLHGVCEHSICAELVPRLEKGHVPVVTGFCGRGTDGATTVLGRGGSDYSATLIGGALRADEVLIWTDVDGVFSADPRVVPEARAIAHLNYREAGELSFYGAKVMHQRTIIPLAPHGIPVTIRNTQRPDAPGTLVDGRFSPGSHPVKAISAVGGRALVSIEGKGMAGVPGVAARAFGALAAERISVTMICQSSSETSICLAVEEEDAIRAEMALKAAFRADLSHGDVEEIVVRREVGIVAAVGLGMAHTPGVARGIFTALSEARINVLAIAQGSSELNISLAVDGKDTDAAVRALHREWRLHRRDTGEESPAGFSLMLVGCGQIGRALIELVKRRHDHVVDRFGLEPRIVAVCDRSGFAFAPTGFADDALDGIVEHKRAGKPIAELGHAADGPHAMVQSALEWRLRRPVLVDVSNDPTADRSWLDAMRLGCDVVTANKEPLASDFERFAALRDAARDARVRLRPEATVGAGLPVVETIEMLLATGDVISRAEGCLSGTLGFLMTRLDAGDRLSEAVRSAIDSGFTEPDAYEDLSGADVERKAVILARLAGFDKGSLPVVRRGLVDESLRGLPTDQLLSRLRGEYDDAIATRVREAEERGEVLRFVASVQASGIEVGLTAVPRGSALGMLQGPDNMIVIRSERYDDRPLVVSGPGAGVEVTAMGVLADILRIAAERQQP